MPISERIILKCLTSYSKIKFFRDCIQQSSPIANGCEPQAIRANIRKTMYLPRMFMVNVPRLYAATVYAVIPSP